MEVILGFSAAQQRLCSVEVAKCLGMVKSL